MHFRERQHHDQQVEGQHTPPRKRVACPAVCRCPGEGTTCWCKKVTSVWDALQSSPYTLYPRHTTQVHNTTSEPTHVKKDTAVAPSVPGRLWTRPGGPHSSNVPDTVAARDACTPPRTDDTRTDGGDETTLQLCSPPCWLLLGPCCCCCCCDTPS